MKHLLAFLVFSLCIQKSARSQDILKQLFTYISKNDLVKINRVKKIKMIQHAHYNNQTHVELKGLYEFNEDGYLLSELSNSILSVKCHDLAPMWHYERRKDNKLIKSFVTVIHNGDKICDTINQTLYEYNPKGRVSRIYDLYGAGSFTDFKYDESGRIEEKRVYRFLSAAPNSDSYYSTGDDMYLMPYTFNQRKNYTDSLMLSAKIYYTMCFIYHANSTQILATTNPSGKEERIIQNTTVPNSEFDMPDYWGDGDNGNKLCWRGSLVVPHCDHHRGAKLTDQDRLHSEDDYFEIVEPDAKLIQHTHMLESRKDAIRRENRYTYLFHYLDNGLPEEIIECPSKANPTQLNVQSYITFEYEYYN